jgi:hypothetical protein
MKPLLAFEMLKIKHENNSASDQHHRPTLRHERMPYFPESPQDSRGAGTRTRTGDRGTWTSVT